MVESLREDKVSLPPAGTPPRLDYSATARRPAWNTLPDAVRALATRWAGGQVDAVRVAGGGFTHGFAAFLEGPRPVFVKAIRLDDPHVGPSYAREVEVLANLPAGAPIPALLEHAVVAGWRVFATTPVRGRMPGSPWTLADARAVHDAARLANTVLSAAGQATLPVAGRLVDEWMQLLDGVDGGRAVLGPARRPAFLPEWFRGVDGDPLAQWILGSVARVSAALAGTTPLNNDLRADNVVIARDAVDGFAAGTAWICDWNFLTLGPGWTDWVVQWPSLYDDGLPLEQITGWELTRQVDDADLDAWLSAVFIYYATAGAREPIPTSPDLRRHQRLCARQALALLAARAGKRS